MRFTDTFINRPVFAISLSLLLLLFGLISYARLETRQYPKINASVIQIYTGYAGASAQLMEGFVTTPIENAISGIDGIDYLKSSSSQGKSEISVHLKLGYEISKAMNDISGNIASIRWKLPKEIDDPVVSENDPSAEPTIFLAFTSHQMSLEAINDYLSRSVQPLMQTQPGVGQAMFFGNFTYAMRIWLNPLKMAAYQVTANDVTNTLTGNNIQSAAGSIKGEEQTYDIYAKTDLISAQQFNNLYVKSSNGRLVRISDIGKAELSAYDPEASINVDGKKAILMGIIPKSTANPLSVSAYIHNLLKTVKTHFPEDMQVRVIKDFSDYIRQSLHEVKLTVFEACLFVFLVIFLMIGSFRAVFVPVVTIPLSIIGTFGIMFLLGYSINILTLLAFVLAIGLVVDDAIVVLENIYRHIDAGMPAKQAAMKGAGEIAFAVIAMTLTLVAVYMPIGFETGLTGSFFKEFAFTLAGAVVVSGFIALTLSPMMCSKIYRKKRLESRFSKTVDLTFSKVRNGYRHLLGKVFHFRYIVVILALVVYASCYGFYKMIPQELAPKEDEGVVFSIMSSPAASSLKYTEAHSKYIEDIYKSVPEMQSYIMISGWPKGISSAMSILILKSWAQRHRTSMEILNTLYPKLFTIPDVNAFPMVPSSLPGTEGFTPINFILKSTGSFKELQYWSQKFLQAAKKIKGLLNVDTTLKIDKPQIVLNINREKAVNLGIPMSDIADSLRLFLGQPVVTRFNMKGRSYDVVPELYAQYRRTPEDLNNIYVNTAVGGVVPLSNLTTISEQVVPEEINHFQQVRAAAITASLAPGVSLGTALDKLNALAKKVLPKNMDIDYSGESRQFMEVGSTMMETFIFALLFIYIVLAAQFESFKDPLIVMLSVPLSLAGALIFLILFRGTLNIYSEIGMVTLIGLITKHGILIVEFANQEQRKGAALLDAVIAAASTRLRPILMTTFAMILGALPLALASGAGAMARRQMGLVIIGGMSFGTLLTLFVVPTVYYLIGAKKAEKAPEEIESSAPTTGSSWK